MRAVVCHQGELSVEEIETPEAPPPPEPPEPPGA